MDSVKKNGRNTRNGNGNGNGKGGYVYCDHCRRRHGYGHGLDNRGHCRSNGHDNRSHGQGYGDGYNGNGEDSRVCVLFVSSLRKQIHVVAVDTSRAGVGELKMNRLSTLHHPVATSLVGFVGVGSKTYVIGGNSDMEGGRYPKQVYYYDFNCDSKQWKEGPALKGGKPDPVVVNVDGKIYALACYNKWMMVAKYEKLDPVFEVLDPSAAAESQVWTPLPDPPFISLYRKGSIGVEFQGHTVIGLNIYVQLVEHSGSVSLYSFNVKKEEWKLHNTPTPTSTNNSNNIHVGSLPKNKNINVGPGGSGGGVAAAAARSDDLIFNNLRLGQWFGGADVVDYLLYMPSIKWPGKGMKVYAFDFAASKQDARETEAAANSFLHDKQAISYGMITDGGDYYFPNDDDLQNYSFPRNAHLVTAPVFGLNHVTDAILGDPTTEGFVAHLRDNMFCFVSLYTSDKPPEKGSYPDTVTRLRACVFEVVSFEISNKSKFMKRYLVAKKVTHDDWMLDSELGATSRYTAWCKIPNKGHRIHLRRPQSEFRKGEKPNCYQDGVAGKLVQKRIDSYVREISINPYGFAELRLQDTNSWQEGMKPKLVLKDKEVLRLQDANSWQEDMKPKLVLKDREVLRLQDPNSWQEDMKRKLVLKDREDLCKQDANSCQEIKPKVILKDSAGFYIRV